MHLDAYFDLDHDVKKKNQTGSLNFFNLFGYSREPALEMKCN